MISNGTVISTRTAAFDVHPPSGHPTHRPDFVERTAEGATIAYIEASAQVARTNREKGSRSRIRIAASHQVRAGAARQSDRLGERKGQVGAFRHGKDCKPWETAEDLAETGSTIKDCCHERLACGCAVSSLLHVVRINQRSRRLAGLDLLPEHAALGADVFEEDRVEPLIVLAPENPQRLPALVHARYMWSPLRFRARSGT
jgi:hypothetical protein